MTTHMNASVPLAMTPHDVPKEVRILQNLKTYISGAGLSTSAASLCLLCQQGAELIVFPCVRPQIQQLAGEFTIY